MVCGPLLQFCLMYDKIRLDLDLSRYIEFDGMVGKLYRPLFKLDDNHDQVEACGLEKNWIVTAAYNEINMCQR